MGGLVFHKHILYGIFWTERVFMSIVGQVITTKHATWTAIDGNINSSNRC